MRLDSRSDLRFLLTVWGVTLAAAAAAPPPAGITFRKVIDSNGVLPGQIDVIGGFFNPALSGTDVAFLSFERAYKRFSLNAELGGTLRRIATSGETELPNGQGKVSMSVTSMSHPLIRNGNVWWETEISGAQASSPGVIQYSQGTLSLLISDAGVDALAGQNLEWPSGNEARLTDDGRVARLLADSGGRGWLIACDSNGLKLLNATGGLSPQNVPITYDWSVYAEGFAFHYGSNPPRFRRQHLGVVQSLEAGYNTLFPTGAILGVDAIHGDGRRLLVQAWHYHAGNFYSGIYGWSGGRWFVVARQGYTLPDGGLLNAFSDTEADRHSLDGNSFLLLGGIDGKRSIILYRDGVLRRLLSVGNELEDGVLSDVMIDRNALDGDRFAFHATFQGGRSGIYIGDFSSLVPASQKTLENTFESGPGARGSFGVSGRPNCFYHFHRSDDLKQSFVVESKAGDGTPLRFSFDDVGSDARRRFYWVEEVRYLPAP
ncbi:hypothetical protein [Luteolibacter soli]|uniref:Delta-60 repeat protein n=1 Tax=Luteolibacter soli TaxID=3135280 RepID=A0ABU9ANW6_9BACT